VLKLSRFPIIPVVNSMRFFELSGAEKLVLVQAAAWLLLLRILLAAAPFAQVQRMVSRASRASAPGVRRPGAPAPSRIGYLVAAAANRIPGTTCLPRALATQVLLCRNGHRAELHIGINRTGSERLQAHAWVETGGSVVIGGSDLTDYRPILRTAR
jgi:hypothetical protein